MLRFFVDGLYFHAQQVAKKQIKY